jgi:hypothetical protein
MALRRVDFPTPVLPVKPDASTGTSCPALDQSDLVLTGEETTQFAAGSGLRYLLAGSDARVYRTGVESARAWQRTTGRAATACFRAAYAQQSTIPGAKLVSFGRAPFPKVAPDTTAFRAVVQLQGIDGQSDVVGLRNGRAQVALVFLGLPDPYPRAEEVRLARLTAKRMAAAVRSARTP